MTLNQLIHVQTRFHCKTSKHFFSASMDITLYYEILKWRGEDPEKIDDNTSPPKPVSCYAI